MQMQNELMSILCNERRACSSLLEVGLFPRLLESISTMSKKDQSLQSKIQMHGVALILVPA